MSNRGARTRKLLLAACAAFALAPATAHAQTQDRTRYNIVSSDLGTALTELARQSNREIYFPAELKQRSGSQINLRVGAISGFDSRKY